MDELTKRLQVWLGADGASFFTGVKQEHGKLNAVLKIPYGDTSRGPQKYFPHSVHFREGMAVRNWLRGQPECKDWDAEKLDGEWAPLVEKALGI